MIFVSQRAAVAKPIAPVNRVLTKFRESVARMPNDPLVLDGYLYSFTPHAVWQWEGDASLEEINHARAILTKLKAVSS